MTNHPTDHDTRRHYLAGYLSGRIPEFRDRHSETLLDLADDILAALDDLAS